ncbi:MAG: hypothetical protein PHR77_11610 [Kiritimatiellae bacterium]|nr:hypothetical protein [Kiritimatiellia bacterium]MDD5520918.1 hypothetical protein [Kiritimatiellia bacterium]
MLKFYESALRYYGNNYYFCILAAENAYYSSFQMAAENAHKNIIRAQQWCDAGLKLNPYRVQLRRLKTCLIALNSPMDAVLYWEKYVDWQYWEPAHHALLIELYALTGQYEKAVGSLSLIKDTPYYVEAAKKLDDAWRKEKTLPRELSEKLSKDNH